MEYFFDNSAALVNYKSIDAYVGASMYVRTTSKKRKQAQKEFQRRLMKY
jgi:hypothetical protein